MNYTVLPKSKVDSLIQAAQVIQQQMTDGIIGNAFCGNNPDHIQDAVTAFDRLNAAATELASENKIASPFIRYRREILANNDTAGHLRALVLALYTDSHVDLSTLLSEADDHHVRIALECIASYSQYGQVDTFFMSLAAELFESIVSTAETIANGLSGVAA